MEDKKKTIEEILAELEKQKSDDKKKQCCPEITSDGIMVVRKWNTNTSK